MSTRIFVLDTNVLMHDPSSLFRFEEHDLYIPMVVLEELDAAKKGSSEVSRNVRQVSRFLDEMIHGADEKAIEAGLPLPDFGLNIRNKAMPTGRLFFQTRPPNVELPDLLPGNKPDNSILVTTLALKAEHPQRQVTLVSKDINLRIKAAVTGISAEDYASDRVLDDLDLLEAGYKALPDGFWSAHGENMESWTDELGSAHYRLAGPEIAELHANQFVYFEDGSGPDLIVRSIHDETATLQVVNDYSDSKQSVWGVHARNREQNLALNLLLDPSIDFVTLLGAAGTGKTLLALAAGLSQTLDHSRFREIIMTRVTVPVGDDIGFLPGAEEEKMTPWMGALMDNLEVLTQSDDAGEWERAATNELLSKRIKIRSVNFMRGRTFVNRYIILDEAQNLTPKQMKTLITRAGPGSKIVCLGNLGQIDTPYLTETNSGLTYVVDHFRGWEHAGHVTLARGERSRLAAFASATL